jgi:hypothetical protein
MSDKRRNRGSEVPLPPDLDARVEAIRARRAVGAELPPRAAVLREAVRLGLPQLEIPNPNAPAA